MGDTKRYIIALDQGTTSSRSLLVDEEGRVVDISQQPFTQYFPQPGWVEHDANEIVASQLATLTDLMVRNALQPEQIAALGITNQRETTVVWDRETGEPVCNAIVWQCRRTAQMVEEIVAEPGVHERIVQTTGLVPDAYFSASKIAWILEEVPGARERAEAGELLFGTIDTWLVWCLTGGRVHATDPTNACRTMLYDIHEGCWDPWLCELFGVPTSMLPEVRPSSGDFGVTAHPAVVGDIPIRGVAGDQQAALFGQCCFESGCAKNTYGTGCFLLMHTGNKAIRSRHGLVTTIAASAPGTEEVEYALEGSVFMAGALIQWLVEELRLISDPAESEALARSVPDTNGVVMVPAFTGLGAPYWDPDARGGVFGLTRGATKAHVVRACLESLAYQLNDLLTAMEADSGIRVSSLAVDGGVSRNSFLMEFQSALSQTLIVRPENAETTAMGAAYLAGLSAGFWDSLEQIRDQRVVDAAFTERMEPNVRQELLIAWENAVARSRSAL